MAYVAIWTIAIGWLFIPAGRVLVRWMSQSKRGYSEDLIYKIDHWRYILAGILMFIGFAILTIMIFTSKD